MQSYELQQNPLDLAAVDNRQRWQLRPPAEDFPAPWASSWGFDKYGLWQCFAIKGIEHKLRYIAPGEFLMGSPKDEPERRDNELLHPVRITQGFWLGETTVTQALWVAVMGENPSHFQDDDDIGLPVERVSWFDCLALCEQVKQQSDGQLLLDLPTEAQWEYACRAGSQTPFNTGEQLSIEQANYDGNYPYNNGPKGEYREKTISVDSFQAKQDKQPNRVLRGGGWFSHGQNCRSAYRRWNHPANRLRDTGLRVTASRQMPERNR